MNILDEIYYKALAENEKSLKFWGGYLENLKALDFTTFVDKLKVPALIPVGSRILFRGEIKHTNEFIIALGADYFTKCSVRQAEVLKQHRIKDAQAKVETFNHEKSYLESQLSFKKRNFMKDTGHTEEYNEHNKHNFMNDTGHEITEEYNERVDLEWRKKHRENLKLYKQKAKMKDVVVNNKDNEELWSKLEELELQEELQNELENMSLEDDLQDAIDISHNRDNFVTVENDETTLGGDRETVMFNFNDNTTSKSKFDIIQKVLDKQVELEEKLYVLKYKEKKLCKNEKDLFDKLNEMEQLDELEDEMDRLEDMVENIEEDDESDESADNQKLLPVNKVKRSVSFADEDENETLELTFKHSNVSSDLTPYNIDKGIVKPSDIYEVYKINVNKTTSILKKCKYDYDVNLKEEETLKSVEETRINIPNPNKTIFIKDVTEKVYSSENKSESKRPTSLFKKSRQQNNM